MKKISILLSALVLGLAMISCEKELDIPQKSVLDLDTYYATAGPEEAEALIARVHKIYYTGVMGIEHNILLDVLSDDHHVGGGGASDNANSFRDAGNLIMTSSDAGPKVMYQSIYQAIYYSNLIVEKIPDSSDATITRAKAEAKFFRAVCMFEALRIWGTPPLVDHLLSQDEYETPNGDPAQIISFVLTNLKEAADALPALSGIGQQKKFGARVSKHTALAYLGKAALWYGSKYKDNAILAQAIDPLKTVVNSGLYGLVDDMKVIERPAGDFCKEYIFEHNAEDSDGFPGRYQSDLRPTWMGLRVENMYLPVGLQGGGWGWDGVSGEFGRFLTNHDGLDSKRFRAWIVTFDQLLAMDYATADKGIKVGGYYDNEGYWRLKATLYSADLYQIAGFWKYSMANSPYMRYSEVLLMLAEAAYLTGSEKELGLKALNQVRTRAGISEVSTLDYQVIKDERRAELWGEQERYFDLVRWGEAATALKDKGKTWYTFLGYKEGTTEWNISTTKGWGDGWNSKYELLPFPYAQLSANSNLKQNQGW